MTRLKESLLKRIEANGPISVAEYMAECLFHPTLGYYTTREVFGVKGDFTTAPEISQMFGELIGLAIAQAWIDRGQPSPFCLAELGPGRGTLMADLLRATSAVPGFTAAADLHLVEASPRLRHLQAETIAADATWVETIFDLPDAPLFLIANEFFDALPIRQFLRDAAGWRERRIAAEGGALRFAAGAPTPVAELDHRLDDTAPGDLVEICPTGTSIAAEIGRRITTSGGLALIIDYGRDSSLGDTFQALKDGAPIDPLESPGEADLTAHVDFAALRASAAPARASSTVPQGLVLERLGITERARVLARGLSGETLASHIAAHRRLTHPDEMGTLFKSMALTTPDAPPTAGFDP